MFWRISTFLSFLPFVVFAGATDHLMIPGPAPIFSETPRTFGTSGITYVSLSALDFKPMASTLTYTYAWTPLAVFRTNPEGERSFAIGLNLPSGAQIIEVELYACDDISGPPLDTDIYMYLSWMSRTPGPFASIVMQTNDAPGCGNFLWVLDPEGDNPGLRIDNFQNSYSIEVKPLYPGIQNRFAAVRVGYKLRVSPPPPTPSFSDVDPSHPFYRFIEALRAAGLTAGCSTAPPMYCPDAPVTRGQMAVFLATALGLHWSP